GDGTISCLPHGSASGSARSRPSLDPRTRTRDGNSGRSHPGACPAADAGAGRRCHVSSVVLTPGIQPQPRLILRHAISSETKRLMTRHAPFVMTSTLEYVPMSRRLMKSAVCCLAGLMLVSASGCTLFGYIPGIPANRVPDSLLARSKDDMQEI